MTERNVLGANSRRVRAAAKLRQKKFRRRTGRILIEGARLVADAFDAGAEVVEVFGTPAFFDSTAGRSLARRCAGFATLVSEAAAAKLSDTRSPQGLFAVVAFEFASPSDLAAAGGNSSVRTDEPSAAPLVLVADGVRDPGNLGAMIRSAAALGASGVLCSGGCCDVLNPKTVRATMGALFRVPVAAGVPLCEALDGLRSRGVRMIAAAADGGCPPWKLDLTAAVALVVGSEAHGLAADALARADARVTIPMPGGTESLNAAAAAAMLLYEAARQRGGPA